MSTTKITKIITSGETNRIQIIKTYWRGMNPVYRQALIGYGVITLGCYITYNYNDGKNALLRYRANTNSDPSGEWKAIKNGINSYSNFWDALFFPWSITSKIMPAIILFLNPK